MASRSTHGNLSFHVALVTAFAWTWNNHRLIRTRHHAVQAYLVHYRAQLARATHDWAHIPPPPIRSNTSPLRAGL
ncbi:MAG UNVERIFIED_CONTAM: hypothetical protein LVT10_24540 [Anaerolineae bacterium]